MSLKYLGLTVALLLPMPIYAMGYSADYLSCVSSGSASFANCAKDEFKYQDDRVETLFKKTLVLYSGKEKKAQKKYQKQWVKQRDQRCDEANKSVSEVYKSKYYTCALKETVNRGNMLERLAFRL